MKKFLCLLMSVILSVTVCCGCDNDDKSVSMKDLPYGSTMRELIDTDIKICFDGRFFDDDEMRAVSNYYFAIQTQNTELFESTQNAAYVEYLEKNSGLTIEDFLKSIASEDSESLGENFEYTYIEVTNMGDATNDTEITEIIDLMNSIYEEKKESKTFKDTVKSGKFATINIIAESGGESYTLSNQIVYVFNCDDGIYIFN